MKYKQLDVIIGAKLKQLRNKKGYSTQYVGDHIGKSNVAITYYEQGRNATDLTTLKQLCNLYDVDMLEFLAEIYEDI